MQPKIPGGLLLATDRSEAPMRRARAAERRSLPPTYEDDPPARERLKRERARLLRRERATNTRLRALQALADAALSHLTLDDLLRELLGRVTAVLGVDSVSIALLDDDGRTLTLRAARGLGEEDVGRVRIPAGQGFVGRILASRAPQIADVDALSAADFEGAHPILRERLRAVAGVPLLVEDRAVGRDADREAAGQPASRLVGVLGVGSVAPRRFTKVDVQLLQLVGDRIALAVDRARLYAAEQDARRCAEAALARVQASEAQAAARAAHLQTILETIAEGVAVTDQDGRYVLTNRAYRALLGADHLPGFDATVPAERGVLLDMRDPITGAPLLPDRVPTARALAGEVVTGSTADVLVRALDGRELELNSSAAPLRDLDDGRIIGVVSVVRDVTWRTRLEREREAAREQAERRAEELDRIFEAVTDGLAVWDAAGRMVRDNAAGRRIIGLDAAPSDFAQLSAYEHAAFFTARDEQDRPVPTEELPIIRALQGELGTELEARDLRMRMSDGREIEVNLSAAPLRDREGRLVGAVSALHDLTERNRLVRERAAARADELAAREGSRRMEAFLATAAHDLRSPLTAVIGYLDLAEHHFDQLAAALREESPALAHGVAGVHHDLEEADRSAERLTRLLTLLFDTAAARADKLELHRTPFDLAALVREQVAAQRVAAPDRTLRLRLPAAPAAPALARPVPVVPVEADADRVGQVLANYLTNALKYAPPERPIDVSVGVRRGWARVAVRDRGAGIPPAERGRVWELFHRVPGAAAQGGTAGSLRGGSLGLGLYISKAIVEAHGGRVGVASAVGEGSTFWFTLPLAGQRSSPRSGPAGTAS